LFDYPCDFPYDSVFFVEVISNTNAKELCKELTDLCVGQFARIGLYIDNVINCLNTRKGVVNV